MTKKIILLNICETVYTSNSLDNGIIEIRTNMFDNEDFKLMFIVNCSIEQELDFCILVKDLIKIVKEIHGIETEISYLNMRITNFNFDIYEKYPVVIKRTLE